MASTTPEIAKADEVKDASKAWGDLPQKTDGVDDELIVDMAAYEQSVPRWQRIYRHSLTQMMLLSVQAFCGPAMSDAIAGDYYFPSYCKSKSFKHLILTG